MGRPRTRPRHKYRRPKWAPYCAGGQTILNIQGDESVVEHAGRPTLLGKHLASCRTCEALRIKWAKTHGPGSRPKGRPPEFPQ